MDGIVQTSVEECSKPRDGSRGMGQCLAQARNWPQTADLDTGATTRRILTREPALGTVSLAPLPNPNARQRAIKLAQYQRGVACDELN